MKFDQNITIFHINSENQRTKIEFKKVYFNFNKTVRLEDKNDIKASSGSILIPTQKPLNISLNDYVINGLIEENEFDLRTFLKKYQVFKIKSIKDNRKGNLQHYKIEVYE